MKGSILLISGRDKEVYCMTAELTVQGSKRKKKVKILLIISFLFMVFVGYVIHWAFFDMNRVSPNSKK